MRALKPLTGETPTVVPPGVLADGGRRVVVLSRGAEESHPVLSVLRTWRDAGHTVVLVWREGEAGDRLRSFKARRQVTPAPLPRSPRALAGRLRDGSLREEVRERVQWRGTLVGEVRADPAVVAELEGADAVLVVGDSAEELTEGLGELLAAAGTPLVPDAEVAWWKELGRTWRRLVEIVAKDEAQDREGEARTAVGAGAGADARLTGVELDAASVAALRDRVALHAPRPTGAEQEALAAVIRGLHRAGEHEPALALTDHLTWDKGEPGARQGSDSGAGRGSGPGAVHGSDPGDVHRRGLAALVRTSATGLEDPDLRAASTALLEAADEALRRVREVLDEAGGDTADGADEGDDTGEVDALLVDVVAPTTLALELLFHRELHADGLSSPLVEDPDGFLAAWRTSQVGQLLGSEVPAIPAVAGDRGLRDTLEPGEVPRVVVSPGTFPKFARPVAAALATRAEVHELDLSHRVDLRWLGVSGALVERRLRHTLGLPAGLDLELVEELERADALFIDWADRAAVELTMSLPAGVRATLRIHSMDALSAWVHLVDWSRVGDLVLVSEHLRELVRGILGERLRHTRLHVVPNVVDLSRLDVDRAEVSEHRRRLLMIGWAQRVKDPLWALEILAALRQDDPAWRLTLLGADFLLNPVVSTVDYAREFWARLVQDDVREAVDIVGFTDDVGPVLARSGYILSMSRRESFGLGLVEGAVSGCVPVVRDWPVYAPLGGARGLFPEEWVVETVGEAVARIRATCDEPAWTRASQLAQTAAQERFGVGSTRERLQQIVLG